MLTAISILKKRQFILYHKPTTSCNCRFEFCDFWKNENTVDSVSTEKIIEIFKEGWKKGLTTYSLWGGEPLMVPDNEGIIFSPEEKYAVFSNLILLKKRGYPVNNSVEALKIMRDGSAHVCNMARNAIHLDSFGNLTPCEPRFVADMEGYGNILKDGLSRIHDKNIYDENIKRLSSCDKCLFPCIAESSNNIYYRGVRRFADFITNKDR